MCVLCEMLWIRIPQVIVCYAKCRFGAVTTNLECLGKSGGTLEELEFLWEPGDGIETIA